MIELIAYAVVVLAAIYLLWLGVVSLSKPAYAASFLNGFACSARIHYLEISLRLIVGASMVLASSRLQYSYAFHLFGWVIVLTSIVLLLIPWQWHHRFARIVVPPLTRQVWLFGLVSAILGAVILYAALF